MRRTRAEMETIILFAADETNATVTTSDPKIRRRMQRLFGKPVDEWGETKRWVLPLSNVLPRRIGAKKGVVPRVLVNNA